MVIQPGPLHSEYGPFVLESVSLSPTLSACRVVRGLTGKGKRPYLALVAPGPRIAGEARAAHRHGTPCFAARLWQFRGVGWIEGFFDTRELAEDFLMKNALCFA